MKNCTMPNCVKPVQGRGLCGPHYAAWHRSQRRYTIACENCGQVAAVPRKGARFCNRSCAMTAASRKAAERRSAEARKRREIVHVGPALPVTWLPAKHPAMQRQRRTKPRMWVSGPCDWCGTAFTIADQLAARFCSDKCAKRSSWATRGRGFSIKPTERVAIYERDGWTCQLCREPVDPELMIINPCDDWAPSLDHVIPQSKGGSHDADNLRLAHRWCNAVRGAEDYHSDLFAVA